MAKRNTNKTATTETVQTVVANPFTELMASATSTGTRKLAYTTALQDKARELAVGLIRATENNPTLAGLATAMLQDKTPDSLLAFITTGLTSEDIKQASTVLDGCPDDDLPKMLESQRSNRSKAKRTGLTAMPKVIDYVTSMIAELLIRERTGKAYNATGTKLPTDHDALAADQETLVKRINSLASKKSRLTKLATYDAKAKAELDEVEAELQELRALRPTKTRKTVKSVKLDDLKAGLAAGSISAEDLQALLTAMKAVNA